MADAAFTRDFVSVEGDELSFLHAGGYGPPVVLIHGTFWSRVWQPVIGRLGVAGEAFALDFPGFGRSGGRLSREEAAVPALAERTLRFLDAVGVEGPFAVVGHDIGGAVAQHLAVHAADRVTRLGLMNAVLYDSWPVPAVERFRDPVLAREISPEELLDGRRQSLEKAVARELSDEERDDYLSPWREEDGVRSWTAMAGAADARYTLELVEPLAALDLPKLLVWGEDDEFQPIAYARRFAEEMPQTELVAIPGARHIPSEDAPEEVARALAGFLAAL